MNIAERNARMILAIKLMTEVMEDARSEALREGQNLDNRSVWKRCGMPPAAHDTQVVDFITKQRFEFIRTTTVNNCYGSRSTPIHTPPVGEE